MHCSQVSSGASQAYAMHAAQGRKAARGDEVKPAQPSDTCSESGGCDDAPRAARHEGRPARNPLVAAMMEALKGLVPGSASAATPPASEAADTAEAGTSESTAKDQAKALKEAAYGFAHELFQALKAVGASGAEESGKTGGCRPRRCGGYGQEAAGASAYGGLAQGMQRLAQSFAAPAAVTPAAPATSTAGTTSPEAVADPSTASDTPTPSAAVDAALVKSAEIATIKTPPPAPSSNNITINLTLNFGAAASSGMAGTGAAQQAESPLLAAFKKLMLALNPPKDSATAGAADAPAGTADAKKPEEMLKAFLQQIAKALGADGDAMPAKGSLVNLTA